MRSLKIIATSDGSHTLYNEQLDETYHSTHGALTESQHVFIKEGLHHFLENNHDLKSINILEVGFGTGLNALLTCIEANKLKIDVNYVTLEPYPVNSNFLSELNYTTQLPNQIQYLFDTIHQAEWEKATAITEHFTILKTQVGLYEFKSEPKFNLVYFDAFAPRKQPELWEVAALEKATEKLIDKGIFVTYSAMGALKRNLRLLGLQVQSIPGPPGKREMTRAAKLQYKK